ncbi:hypothetical protein [Actinoplanes sp. URMC 104]|uniref:hypothetical protein n=1 Tax=Actinoplanes sp. URMC 104 TaxID=3423409 RepID=UPI003F1D20A7
MRLPEGYEYAYAYGEDTQWCIHAVNTAQTLCGQRVEFAAELTQPADPQRVHRACLQAVAALADPATPSGVCPMCAGEVPLQDDRIGPHGACPGVNLPPHPGKRRERRTRRRGTAAS